MLFHSEKGLVPLINTDYERAKKIADLIKDNLKIDCRFDGFMILWLGISPKLIGLRRKQ